MKPERSGRNLAEKSGTNRDLKWDENCSVLFCFLNWYGMFRSFRTKQNEIDNLDKTCPFVSLSSLFIYLFIYYYKQSFGLSFLSEY